MTQNEQRDALKNVLAYLDRDLKISGIQNIETVYRCVSIIAQVVQSIDSNIDSESPE